MCVFLLKLLISFFHGIAVISAHSEVHWSQSTLTRRNTLRRHDNIAENATEDTSADGAGSCLTLGQSLGNLSMDSLGDGDDLLDGSNGTTRSAGLTAVPSEHQYVPVNPVDVDESFIVSVSVLCCKQHCIASTIPAP